MIILALSMSVLLGACSTRSGIDIDNPEISSAYEKHQEALQAYEEVAEVGHAWVGTADLVRLSYLALEDGEPEASLQYSARAQREAELAYKQYTQQSEYADVFGVALRCAVYYPELDCSGYAAYAEANAPASPQPSPQASPQASPQPSPQPSPGFAGESITDASPARALAETDMYVVVRGDSLWKISARQSIYGDPFRWPLIFKTNASKIKDADLIFPKQRFNIFRGFDPSEIDRAVLHARTRGAWVVGETEASDTIWLNQ